MPGSSSTSTRPTSPGCRPSSGSPRPLLRSRTVVRLEADGLLDAARAQRSTFARYATPERSDRLYPGDVTALLSARRRHDVRARGRGGHLGPAAARPTGRSRTRALAARRGGSGREPAAGRLLARPRRHRVCRRRPRRRPGRDLPAPGRVGRPFGRAVAGRPGRAGAAGPGPQRPAAPAGQRGRASRRVAGRPAARGGAGPCGDATGNARRSFRRRAVRNPVVAADWRPGIPAASPRVGGQRRRALPPRGRAGPRSRDHPEPWAWAGRRRTRSRAGGARAVPGLRTTTTSPALSSGSEPRSPAAWPCTPASSAGAPGRSSTC